MMSIEAVINELSRLFCMIIVVHAVIQPFLDDVEDEVSVFLCGSRENHYLKQIRHLFQKL